ncbi:MAG: hypothetical protein ABSG05_01260 [Candidatus Pacearchaeota archaeon]|jgi:hypothetical protein
MVDIPENEDGWTLVVSPSTPPDFRTHLNYVTFMKDLSEELTAKLNKDIVTKSNFSKKALAKKINLIKIIKESLEEEYKKALKEKDFAKVCSMWIPVKSYYLIFNLLLVTCALFNNDENNLNFPHHKTISNFRNMLKNKDILFSKAGFNMVESCEEAINFISKSGDTLRLSVDEQTRINSILKKLCKYKFEDFCRYTGLKHFQTKIDRKKKEGFFKNSEISLFEFFYWYRIKTNYRDLDFLNQEIYSGEIIEFYQNYYFLTMNFYNSLKNLINELSKKRLGESILS